MGKRLLSVMLAVVITWMSGDTLTMNVSAASKLPAGNVIYCSSVEEAADYVREQLVAREETIQFFYRGEELNEEVLGELHEDILEQACIVTDEPLEGDYLRYHLLGVRQDCVSSNYEAHITWTVSYTSDAWQEQQMRQSLKKAVKSLAFDKCSDEKKVKKIHDYICEKVSYSDNGSSNCHSAYSALEEGYTVCQGYATLFYAMAVQAGLNVRCVEGYGKSQLHLWNIVEVDGRWYNLDVTWDDSINGTRYDYYLQSDSDFLYHTRSSEYKQAEFKKQYAVSNLSYEDMQMAPGKVKISQIKPLKNAIRLKWKTIENAQGYEILLTYKNGNRKIKRTLSVSAADKETQIKKVKGLKAGKTYSVKIRAYTKLNGEKLYGKYSAVKKKTVK